MALASAVAPTQEIVISGWRFLPHSYAVVGTFQARELLSRHQVRLYFSDAIIPRTGWQPHFGTFDPSTEQALQQVPPAPSRQVDVLYRISYPYNIAASAAKHTFVFATSEFGLVPPEDVTPGMSLRDHLHSDVVIVTPSHWSRRGFLRSGAHPARVIVIPLGVDATTFRPASEQQRAELRHRLGWDDCFVFLHVGGMSGNKGVDLILAAFAEVLNHHPNALLVLKGVDELYSSRSLFSRLVASLRSAWQDRVARRIVYIGRSLAHCEVAELYQAADAYVSPYLAEGFNLPVLEAAACGLPVICTSGGPTDDFTHQGFAWRIKSRLGAVELGPRRAGFVLMPDQDYLTQLMTLLLEDRELAHQARSTGPAFVQSRFTWKHSVDRLLETIFPNGRTAVPCG